MTQPSSDSSSASRPDAPAVKLAAKVAHELNNPLDAVLRLVSLAQRKAQSGDYGDLERHLADAQFGLQRMAEILRELLEIGRQSGEPRSVRLLPLDQQVALAARTIMQHAEARQVTLACDLPGQPLPHHDARLTQVLANLLKNAIDAAPAHSAVTLKAVVEADRLTITVEDRGPGIDPTMLPRLFTPFVTTKSCGKGYGLGLAISRELILALHGTLTLANAPSGGGLATVILPLLTC